MPAALAAVRSELRAQPRRWLVTGSAGFIGSHLVEALLQLGQHVVGLDNFATGHRRNLDEVRAIVGRDAWRRHRFIEGDIADAAACRACVRRRRHRAAPGRARLGAALDRGSAAHARAPTPPASSTCWSPRATRASTRFVYAASSSTYGDHPGLPKVEDRIGRPLSPYAVTKYLERALRRRVRPLLRHGDDRPALLQRVRPAPGSRRRLRRGDSALGRGDARAARRSRSTATARRRATSATSPTSCRPTCSRRLTDDSAALRPGLQRRGRRTHVAERALSASCASSCASGIPA